MSGKVRLFFRAVAVFVAAYTYAGKDANGNRTGDPLPSDEKMKRRNTESKTVADEFFEWISTVEASTESLRKAVTYTINERKYLLRFLEHPDIAISNNRAENAVRPFVVGRKNWLFCDSVKGADASAAWYSIIQTAYQNGLNVEQYLIDILSSDVSPQSPSVIKTLNSHGNKHHGSHSDLLFIPV